MYRVIKELAPPLLWRTLAKLRQRLTVPEWEYMPKGWQTTALTIKGWNVEDILYTYQTKWPAFIQSLEGPRPFVHSPEAISNETDLAFHNAMMSYAYAFTLATRNKSHIAMLDWGGGIGHYYFISHALVRDIEIEYHCKDMSVLVEHGRELLPQAHFYTDEVCLTRKYDFVLASTSLHYSPRWESVLKGLAQSTEGYMFITGLPVVHHVPSYVFVQRPYQYGYNTEYLGWCINRQEFLKCAETTGLELMREFVIGYRPFIQRAPEQNEYRGFLFRRITPIDIA